MKRLYQHREGVTKGFTWRYSVFRLVHYEAFADMERAILREKQLKRWHRAWKINLIEERNPHWEDLAVSLGFDPQPIPVMLNSFPHPSRRHEGCSTKFRVTTFPDRGAAPPPSC